MKDFVKDSVILRVTIKLLRIDKTNFSFHTQFTLFIDYFNYGSKLIQNCIKYVKKIIKCYGTRMKEWLELFLLLLLFLYGDIAILRANCATEKKNYIKLNSHHLHILKVYFLY